MAMVAAIALPLALPASPVAAKPSPGRTDPVFDVPEWVLKHGEFTHWYPDTTQLVKERKDAANAQAWKDVIGSREFDTKGIAAAWHGSVLKLAIFTNFPDRNVMAAGRPVAPADLALDLDGNGTLETAIVLSEVRETGDKGIRRSEKFQLERAYRVKKWYKPGDILKNTYGQGWRWKGLEGQEFAYASVPVWAAEAEEREDLKVKVSWMPNGEGSDYVVFVTISHTEGKAILMRAPAIWGTGICGNDVIFAAIARDGDLMETVANKRNGDAADGGGGENGDGIEGEEVAHADITAEDIADDAGMTEQEPISEETEEEPATWNDPLPVAFPQMTSGGGGAQGGGGGSTSGGTGSGGGSGSSSSSGSGSGSGSSGGSSGSSAGGSGGGGSGGTGGGGSSTEGGGSGSGSGEESGSSGGGSGSGAEGGGSGGGGGSGQQVVIPEPPLTGLALAASFGAILWRRRRRG